MAFFGCLYFAALRPEEAVALAKHTLSFPEQGWGEMTIDTAEPPVEILHKTYGKCVDGEAVAVQLCVEAALCRSAKGWGQG